MESQIQLASPAVFSDFKGFARQPLAEMRLKTPDIFKEKAFIGEGTFGKVYKAKIGDSLYALKKIKIDGVNKANDPNAPQNYGFPITTIREIKMLKKLADHPNIVQLVDIVRSKSQSIYLVFEYVEFDIKKLMDRAHIVFSKPQLKYIFKQILEGLAFMHSKGIIHRDIKSENLLIDPKG